MDIASEYPHKNSIIRSETAAHLTATDPLLRLPLPRRGPAKVFSKGLFFDNLAVDLFLVSAGARS
ncbi:MAG: hypothetical protein DWH98_07910 [Planctomycetota bacterium]|nr:MAG: hypothetical protein DWH98_07910 [Planctomycetota bacterium]